MNVKDLRKSFSSLVILSPFYCSAVIPLLDMLVDFGSNGIVVIGRKLCSPPFLLCRLGFGIGTANDRLGLDNVIVVEQIMGIFSSKIRVNKLQNSFRSLGHQCQLSLRRMNQGLYHLQLQWN